MYFFFKKIYSNITNQKNKCLIISYIPYFKINLNNFFSKSYFISYEFTKKKSFKKKIKQFVENHKIDKIYYLSLDNKYLTLLNYLEAKQNKNNFDYQNANWGFKYYLKSLINRDKVYPNYNKKFENPFINSIEIKIDFNRKNVYASKIFSLSDINENKILLQIQNMNEKFFNNNFTKYELNLIDQKYD